MTGARRLGAAAAVGLLGTLGFLVVRSPQPLATASEAAATAATRPAAATATPIRHVIVIYQENASFDHYFGTYPHAANPVGEPRFVAAPGTPKVDGLTPALLAHNPNLANPFRLDRADAFTCDQLHEYPTEQRSADGGKLDEFVQWDGTPDPHCSKTQVMGYYDGNTVTALWNYAQRFALSDAFFGTTYGPSAPGAVNLVAANTSGATPSELPEMVSNGVLIGDADPAHDSCSGKNAVSLSGRNIGNLLNDKHVTWGWFEAGFADCSQEHANLQGTWEADYEPHHEPFQFFASTANPNHTPPASLAEIGHAGAANHQYDLSSFWDAAGAGDLPAVSFLKAPNYEDGHPSTSDPLDEQEFLVQTINRIEQLPDWSSTAIVIAWDDSDGWYDHVFTAPKATSADPAYDGLDGQGRCGTSGPKTTVAADRCGPGPRLPFLVVSPYARRNAVSHVQLEQASIIHFIEDNWHLGRLGGGSFDARAASLTSLFDFKHPDARPLILDPATGNPSVAETPTPPSTATDPQTTTSTLPVTVPTPGLPTVSVPTVSVPTISVPATPTIGVPTVSTPIRLR